VKIFLYNQAINGPNIKKIEPTYPYGVILLDKHKTPEFKMKIITLFIFLFALTISFSRDNAQIILGVAYEARSAEWYGNQAQLWKAQTKDNPANAEAWFNYYRAYRYANFC